METRTPATESAAGQPATVIKQHVWGLGYIDEICQIAINGEPTDDPGFDPDDAAHDLRAYYPMQDASYNVMGIVDATGVLVERYEYTPYGQRTTYISAGANDPDCYLGTLRSQRVQVADGSGGTVPLAWGICDIGHQGLMHDEELGGQTALIYNRARMLHPTLGRFMQRDPLGYVDGMSTYAGYHVMRGGSDAEGTRTVTLMIRVTAKDRLPQGFQGSLAEVRRILQSKIDASVNAGLTQDRLLVAMVRSDNKQDLGIQWSYTYRSYGFWVFAYGRACKDRIIAYAALVEEIDYTVQRNGINGSAVGSSDRRREYVWLWPGNLAQNNNLRDTADLWANVVGHEVLHHTLLDRKESSSYAANDIRHSKSGHTPRSILAGHADEIRDELDLQ